MSKVLLTGFSSFGSVVSNPSQRLVDYFSKNPPESIELATVTLPVVWSKLHQAIAEEIATVSPDYILMMGVATNRKYWSVETSAKNVVGNIPDALGKYPEFPVLDANGIPVECVTLPMDALVGAISASGLPVQRSDDAGTYLCNAALYRGLQIGKQKQIPTGFLHIPADQETYGEGNSEHAYFTFEQHVKALTASFEVLQ